MLNLQNVVHNPKTLFMQEAPFSLLDPEHASEKGYIYP